MYIFLDSNIFFNNWHLKSADFGYLLRFIENTDSTLIVSELVCQEIDNIYNKHLNEIIDTLNRHVVKATKHTSIKKDYNFDVFKTEYNLKSVLKDKDINLDFFNYNEIGHEVVVKRALITKKPFQEGEKGYRDTLIWLSLLSFLKKEDIKEDVAFITNNKDDFFRKGKIELHDNLKADIQEHNLKCNLLPYDSLYNFVSSNINKEEHEFSPSTVTNYLYSIERELEDITSDFINQMPSHDLQVHLQRSEDFKFVKYLTGHAFSIEEGIEDPKVLWFKKAGTDTVYVNCSFNLRICELDLEFPTAFFDSIKEKVGIYGQSENELTIRAVDIVRVYLDVTFNYNVKSENIDGFNIINVFFVQR